MWDELLVPTSEGWELPGRASDESNRLTDVTGLRYGVRLNNVYFRAVGNEPLLLKEEALRHLDELRANLTAAEGELKEARQHSCVGRLKGRESPIAIALSTRGATTLARRFWKWQGG